ncbi:MULTISPECIES: hypothetical protein [unclassified Streptomyces]|uniref:hypothetical protein n=1 Tax=unclassified Streptomyces TaxID=2593676 RepID=UPI0011637705|nr:MULTISPECIES: hypothetical protein [unclassified Streptomyces]NMI54641.1 hypothetical protein [Streptomyces sp. RLA2-12]QDN62804.1 hypothetical protein FNV67_53230 [Streptomyces sp. S1D4-20]QDN72856.1 hypothetical protein FNV66_52095 [Streptomyces sp. S1D4-14]QDO55381.1 hypothetical protein FNV60_50965 [Streptomyces sp. RLB3-5]QDO65558.1 hypothetical protein FNV59_52805 [Streptomyces sp. RLB1-8]
MRIAPRTVIWLNETQHYLFNAADPELGERIAAGLPALLITPERAPVLILGTIWPEHVAALAGPPTTDVDDRHAQARALLAGRDLAVTSTFADAALVTAKATGDPRPTEAARPRRRGPPSWLRDTVSSALATAKYGVHKTAVLTPKCTSETPATGTPCTLATRYWSPTVLLVRHSQPSTER